MRARLRKLAAASAMLRTGVKTAGAGKAVLNFVAKRPIQSAVLGAGTVLAGKAGVDSAKSTKAGFDPKVNNFKLGLMPTPPGANG